MVAFETGESDSNAILPDNLDHFKNNVKHVNVVTGQTFAYTYIGYNHKNPMFADVRVRQAITHAINRQEIVDEILKGQGAVAHGHFSPIRWDYNPNVPIFNFDVNKSAQLLDAAGWRLGADGLRAKDGQKMTFELATNAGNKAREQSAVIVQQALKKIGITVNLNYMEWNAFLDHVDGDKKQAYILGWSLGFDPDSTSIFHSKGGFAMMHGYANPKIDELYERGIKVADIPTRKAIYGEAQEILARDQVYTWLFFANAIQGVNQRVGGVPGQIGPAGLTWQFEEWFLKDTRTTK
jgi:peptide/nickel transport system substrate-binding protein